MIEFHCKRHHPSDNTPIVYDSEIQEYAETVLGDYKPKLLKATVGLMLITRTFITRKTKIRLREPLYLMRGTLRSSTVRICALNRSRFALIPSSSIIRQ